MSDRKFVKQKSIPLNNKLRQPLSLEPTYATNRHRTLQSFGQHSGVPISNLGAVTGYPDWDMIVGDS